MLHMSRTIPGSLKSFHNASIRFHYSLPTHQIQALLILVALSCLCCDTGHICVYFRKLSSAQKVILGR